jgi:hypothetical protein
LHVQGGELLAYQIAFDLYENASQQFIAKIERALHPVCCQSRLSWMYLAGARHRGE